MLIKVRNRCSDFKSYRAARVKSMFNAESGCNFDHDAQLDIDDTNWKVGVVVGPSGSGKTSIGRLIWPQDDKAFYTGGDWPADAPIVDAIAPAGDFDAVTGALAAVGLGDVPAWLRPYSVLSNGEKFRADLARIVSTAPPPAWSSTSSALSWTARLPRSAAWPSARPGSVPRGRPCCCRAITT